MYPITYWLPERIANPIADIYGDRLEALPLLEQLNAVRLISGYLMYQIEEFECQFGYYAYVVMCENLKYEFIALLSELTAEDLKMILMILSIYLAEK